MAKPTYGPLWATSGDRVPPTSGKRASGFKPRERPAAQLFNDVLGNLGDWVAFLAEDRVVHRSFDPEYLPSGNWAMGTHNGNLMVLAGAAGTFFESLGDVPIGHVIKEIRFSLFGDGAADLDVVPHTTYRDDTFVTAWEAAAGAAAYEYDNEGAAYSEKTIDLDVTTAALTVTVAAGAGTFTRSAGNFFTDGLRVGMRVNWTGFTNAGNNVSRRLITAMTATVMTFADTSGLVNETGNGNEVASHPGFEVTDDYYLVIRFTASAANLRVKSLKYTHGPA